MTLNNKDFYISLEKTLNRSIREQQINWGFEELRRIFMTDKPILLTEDWFNFSRLLSERQIVIEPVEPLFEQDLINEMAKTICENSNSSWDAACAKAIGCLWLKEIGEEEPIVHANRNTLTAPNLMISVRSGNAKPLDFFRAIESGNRSFAIVSYTNSNTIFVLRPTELFFIAQKKRDERSKELIDLYLGKDNKKLNKVFKETRGSAITYINKTLEQNDLIVFKEISENGKEVVYRGIFVAEINPQEDCKKFFVEHETPENTRKVWKGTDIDSCNRGLVYTPRTNSNSLTFDYRTPKINNIQCISFDVDLIVDTAISFINSTGTLIPLKFNIEGPSNAAYHPDVKMIEIFVLNMNMTIIKNFIDKEITPEETVKMILCHELGHADPEYDYLYQGFSDLVNELNEHGKRYQGISFLFDERDTSLSETYLDKMREYNRISLMMEQIAWKQGRKYVPETLLAKYDEDNLDGYLGYLKEADKREEQILWQLANDR